MIGKIPLSIHQFMQIKLIKWVSAIYKCILFIYIYIFIPVLSVSGFVCVYMHAKNEYSIMRIGKHDLCSQGAA